MDLPKRILIFLLHYSPFRCQKQYTAACQRDTYIVWCSITIPNRPVCCAFTYQGMVDAQLVPSWSVRRTRPLVQ